MKFISGEEIVAATSFKELVEVLRKGFCSEVTTPLRHHHDFSNPKAGCDSTLLLMPSWELGQSLGVKMVTVAPENGRYGLPSVHGIYVLTDIDTGEIKAIFDGKELTVKRTAAASALATSYLAPENSNTMLMIGTGALAPNLIRAHVSQRPIENVWIWGRNIKKAEHLVAELGDLNISISAVKNLDRFIPEADIISCATLSKSPLIKGSLLRSGQHVDLVGAYKKDMREADDELIRRAAVFVDTDQGIYESGELYIPLANKVILPSHIQGNLSDFCTGRHKGRTDSKSITVFKSVGHASEDLMAANYFFDKLQ